MLAAPQGSSPREPPFPLNKHPYPWGRVQPKGSGCSALQGLPSWYWALCLAVCPTWGKDKPHFSCPIKEHKVSFEHHTFTLFFFFFFS